MNKYILASFNQNKLLEIQSKLTDIHLLSLSDIGYKEKIIESGTTLKENALIKALSIYKKYNIPCISDDTGLEVHALDGEPGVLSARYAGIDADAHKNINKLLLKLNGINDRQARFRTIICLKTSLDEVFFEGVVEGFITDHPIGNGGFGYDPIFIPKGFSCTFSQMSLHEKNKISHRGKALQKLITYLNK